MKKLDALSILLQSPHQIDYVPKFPEHEIPLHLACEESIAMVVHVLVRYGADVNRKYNGMTPLMVACKRGHHGIVQRLLHEPNVDIDAVDSNGKSALHFAMYTLTSKIVTSLVTKGANPNVRDKSG